MATFRAGLLNAALGQTYEAPETRLLDRAECEVVASRAARLTPQVSDEEGLGADRAALVLCWDLRMRARRHWSHVEPFLLGSWAYVLLAEYDREQAEWKAGEPGRKAAEAERERAFREQIAEHRKAKSLAKADRHQHRMDQQAAHNRDWYASREAERRRTMNPSLDFCILAPVPAEHIEASIELARPPGFVAFGSRKFELFRQIDALRQNLPVPVFLYASHDYESARASSSVVTWRGMFIGSEETQTGAHSLGMEHRPETTAAYANDNAGHWAVFWHVQEILPLATPVPISRFRAYKGGGWRKNAPPRGPELAYLPDFPLEPLAS